MRPEWLPINIDWNAELSQFGGFLRCETCGTVQTLGDLNVHIGTGWPVCCGYTMRWWTQRQITEGEAAAAAAAAVPSGNPEAGR